MTSARGGVTRFADLLRLTVLWVPLCVLKPAVVGAGVSSGYVDEGQAAPEAIAGSAVCAECHPTFHALWKSSRHGASVVPVTAEWANRELGLASPAGGEASGLLYGLEINADTVCLRTRGVSDSIERYAVEFALGGRDTWYLLGELEDGRLQVLPMAYDVRRSEWFDPALVSVPPHASLRDGDVHWRSAAYTFSEGCYACHVSGFGGASGDTSNGSSRWWDEPGIRCESCHGPAAEHVRICREADRDPPPRDLRIISVRTFSVEQLDGLCGSCHAKRAALTPAFRPGDVLEEHFDLALLEDPAFAVDGREIGETYTMTSWLANPCRREGGLSCLHCHTSSGRNRFPAERSNEACLPCHGARVLKSEPHSHHMDGGRGGRCVDCHMPVMEYARMRRHDHSFRPPTPAVTLAFGSPNACDNCHREEGAAWADRQVRAWYKADYQAAVVRRARWIERARRGDWSDLEGMLRSLRDDKKDALYVASLIRLLSGCEDGRKIPALIEALAHPSPWVQSSAALGLEGHLTPGAVPGLLRMASDDRLLLRLRAAQALAPLPEGVLEPSEDTLLGRTFQEFEDWLRSRDTDPGAMEMLAHFLLDRGEPEKAASWFDRALDANPESLGLLISSGTAHYRADERTVAGERFERAVELHPESAMAWSNWIRFLRHTGQDEKVETALQSASGRLESGELRK